MAEPGLIENNDEPMNTYNISKLSMLELKRLSQENGIRGISHLIKHELIEKLINNGILPKDIVDVQRTRREERKSRVGILGLPRFYPRCVEILDKDTGIISEYPSMYKAGKSLGIASSIIFAYNGRVFRNRYKIKITTN